MLQDVVLFDDTVANNVIYGSMDEKNTGLLDVLHACKAAGIHKEIMALQLAYDTNLGEKGATLSGGQRQRLSLARVISKSQIFSFSTKPHQILTFKARGRSTDEC